MITAERLREILEYDPDTGHFINRCVRGNQAKGIVAGTKGVTGYIQIRIENVFYTGHRLAFLYMEGEWPSEVDHINHIRHDNRWENLRIVTRQGNTRNRSKPSNNTSGMVGVTYYAERSQYRAFIGVDYKFIHLGYFDNFFDAVCARALAEDKYNFHYNHGI